jgi:F-type H+-transporting ATPase subunit b
VEVNWSTFVLEIINFLILVWIIKHFFYAPVMKIIEKRRNEIRDGLAQVEAKQKEVESVEQKYKSRLAEWENEKNEAREALHKELQSERERLERKLEESIEGERKKTQVLAHRQQDEMRRKIEQQSLYLASTFASKLLTSVSGPELEEKLLSLLLQQLESLPDEQRDKVSNLKNNEPVSVNIESAYPVPEKSSKALQNALSKLVDTELKCVFTQNEDLLAGFRICLGPVELDANLQDELRFFAEATNAGA